MLPPPLSAQATVGTGGCTHLHTMRRDVDAARLNQTPPVQISDSHDHDKALGTCAMHFQRDQQKLRV
ncbi:hypothetical protein SFRURICE_009376 [Spodoptera frugiperda]|nr:hypothetical protein SFRURICE_009376 [Spodoptera frugiperda]